MCADIFSINKVDLPGSWKDVAGMITGLEGTRYGNKGQRLVCVVCALGLDVTSFLIHHSGVAWKRNKEGKVSVCGPTF